MILLKSALNLSTVDNQSQDVLYQRLSEFVAQILISVIAELSAFAKNLTRVYSNAMLLFRQLIVQSMVAAFTYHAASVCITLECSDKASHSFRSVEITRQFKRLGPTAV